MVKWWQGFVSRELARVRRDGRAAVLWSLRITIAATASYVVASLIFPGTLPLLAPLTAMLVVQVTPLSLLASGLDRVVSVAAGVVLAVGFAAVVPLEWWSLGLLILVSITIGQFLRLRSNLVEVAISAMLVLGVGGRHHRHPAVPAQGRQRRCRPRHRRAGRSRQGAAGPGGGRAQRDGRGTPTACRALPASCWTTRGASPTTSPRSVPRCSRRRKVAASTCARPYAARRAGAPAGHGGARALRRCDPRPDALGAGLRRRQLLAEDSAPAVLNDLAATCRELAAAFDAFGNLVRNEADVQVELSRGDIARLQEALDGMHRARTRLDTALAAERSPDVTELYSATRATVRRLQHELPLDERVRRQLRLSPLPRRMHLPSSLHRPHEEASRPPAGPDAATEVLPQVREDPPGGRS